MVTRCDVKKERRIEWSPGFWLESLDGRLKVTHSLT